MMSTSHGLPARALSRGHRGALLSVAFAVLGGTTLITAGAVLTETSLRAQVTPARLADAQVLVSAPQRIPVVEDVDVRLTERATVPTDLAERIAAVPGVDAAAADVAIPASITVAGVSTAVEAHPWPVAALGEPALRGTAPTSDSVVVDDEIAGPIGLEVGDRLEFAAGASRHDLWISGIVDAPGADVHVASSTAEALGVVPVGASDLIAVRVSAGARTQTVASAIEKAVGDEYEVTTGDARGAVESLASGNARLELAALSASLAGTLLLLVGCIVASALSTLVTTMRRELALVRAVGATPRQVRGLVARQATLATVCGLVPGLALGYPLAGWFCAQLASRGMLSADVPVVYSPLAGLVVLALVLLVVQLTARATTWRASRRPATEALGDAQVEPRHPSRVRTGLGLGLIALSLAPAFGSLVVRGEGAFVSAVSGTLVGIVGLGLAGPVIARSVTGWLARHSDERTPVVRWLALRHTHAHAMRTAGAVSVLALAFSLTVAQVYSQSSLERAAAAEQSAGMTADMMVQGPLAGADVAAMVNTPGIDAAVPMTSISVVGTTRMFGDEATERFAALAVGPGADRVLDLDVDEGDLADLHGEAIALDAEAARRWDLEVGDRADLRLGNGAPVEPVVVATYRRGFGFGTVVASTDLLHEHGLARSTDTVLVAGDSAALQTWASDHPGHAIAPASLSGDGADPDRWLGLIVLLPLLGYVLVAVAGSLRTTTRRRREEFATLRLLGATPRQVRTMVTREALVLSVLTVAAGGVLSVLPMSVLGLGLLGRPWPQGPLWVIPAISAVVTVVALASMRGGMRTALR